MQATAGTLLRLGQTQAEHCQLEHPPQVEQAAEGGTHLEPRGAAPVQLLAAVVGMQQVGARVRVGWRWAWTQVRHAVLLPGCCPGSAHGVPSTTRALPGGAQHVRTHALHQQLS
jgi:hypothetical protein